jgi:hypothetical protein
MADYIILHSTLEWQGAQVSDLSHVLIHHTFDWCIHGLCQRADTKLNLVSARSTSGRDGVRAGTMGRNHIRVLHVFRLHRAIHTIHETTWWVTKLHLSEMITQTRSGRTVD